MGTEECSRVENKVPYASMNKLDDVDGTDWPK